MVRTLNILVKLSLNAGMQPRSLELYHLLGVLPDINSLGIRTPTIKICVAGTRDEEVLSVSDMYPSLEPTPAFPIVSSPTIFENMNLISL